MVSESIGRAWRQTRYDSHWVFIAVGDCQNVEALRANMEGKYGGQVWRAIMEGNHGAVVKFETCD